MTPASFQSPVRTAPCRSAKSSACHWTKPSWSETPSLTSRWASWPGYAPPSQFSLVRFIFKTWYIVSCPIRNCSVSIYWCFFLENRLFFPDCCQMRRIVLQFLPENKTQCLVHLRPEPTVFPQANGEKRRLLLYGVIDWRNERVRESNERREKIRFLESDVFRNW